ncbi:hypothetical protein [Pseudomonas rhodesiae]|uniref:hypothetical protein n=1 Tax=Pseudomonas rhodesiae TaxID=76760 RepID=UPI00241C21B5|nr:hypothetical protein [Pseudomonas rhodesiae]
MNMKIAGLVIGVVGFIMLMLAMYMDTTVAVSDVYTSSLSAGMRVHNVGLVAEKQNSLMLAIAFIVVGVLLYGFGSVAAARSAPSAGHVSSVQDPETFTPEDLMRAISTGNVSDARRIVASGLDLKKPTGGMSFVDYADFHDQVEIKEMLLMQLEH